MQYKARPRGPMRDNSKSISVRMTEEQFQRLSRYMALTHLPVTAYFRKLICSEKIGERTPEVFQNIHAAVNMLYSNIRQITRCPRAKELDADATEKLSFLMKQILEHVYRISCQE